MTDDGMTDVDDLLRRAAAAVTVSGARLDRLRAGTVAEIERRRALAETVSTSRWLSVFAAPVALGGLAGAVVGVLGVNEPAQGLSWLVETAYSLPVSF